MGEQMTVTQAAEYLDVTRGRVKQLIEQKRVDAEKIGSVWIITRKSVEHYAATRQGPKAKKK